MNKLYIVILGECICAFPCVGNSEWWTFVLNNFSWKTMINRLLIKGELGNRILCKDSWVMHFHPKSIWECTAIFKRIALLPVSGQGILAGCLTMSFQVNGEMLFTTRLLGKSTMKMRKEGGETASTSWWAIASQYDGVYQITGRKSMYLRNGIFTYILSCRSSIITYCVMSKCIIVCWLYFNIAPVRVLNLFLLLSLFNSWE